LSNPTAEDRFGRLDTAGGQYRQLENAYGRALRILNHAARRGDAGAALQAINVRSKAMDEGFAPGGIRQSGESTAGILGMVDAKKKRAQMAEQEAALLAKRGEEELAASPPVRPNVSGMYEDDTYQGDKTPPPDAYQSPEAAADKQRNTGSPLAGTTRRRKNVGLLGRISNWMDRVNPF
jgi:hypothetical protein